MTKLKKKSLGILNNKVQGRKWNFNIVSNEKINKMMERNYQVRSVTKIKWAVKAYDDWRTMRLDRDDCEHEILEADIHDVAMLTKQNLEFALCRFICEVKKSKQDEDYPGCTLYQMTCAIQSHLHKKDIDWKIVHGGQEFRNFNRVLDSVMQERAAHCIGTVKWQAEVISLEFENKLWEQNILGDDNPDKLQSTVLF